MYMEVYYRRTLCVTDECRSLTSDSPDVSNQLCQAMVALQDRPILFKYVTSSCCAISVQRTLISYLL